MPRELKIKDVARLTGLTVRALHYYDEIGLLKPEQLSTAGYRLYGQESLERLQQILFYRELDFSLSDIMRILENPAYCKEEALKRQELLLIAKRDRLNGLIALVQACVLTQSHNTGLKGESDMSFEAFDTSQIEKMKNQYAKEAMERWGSTKAYEESEKKTKGYSPEQWKEIQKESDLLIEGFAAIRHMPPDCQKAQDLVSKWQAHITRHYYRCTTEILAGLGQMYQADSRFLENLDLHGQGTGEFMAKSISIYCNN